MNRSEMREENKEIKKQRRKARRRKIINFIKMTFLIIILTGVGIAGYLGYKYYPDYKTMSAEADEIIEQINERTFIRLDPTQIVRKDDSVVREFTKAPYKYIESHEMPSDVKDAFVAIEDKSFYDHEGVDLKANLRAVKALVDNKGDTVLNGFASERVVANKNGRSLRLPEPTERTRVGDKRSGADIVLGHHELA